MPNAADKLTASLIGCALVVSILVTTHYKTIRDADTHLSEAVFHVDQLVGQAARASQLVPSPLPPCGTLATLLREHTVRHPVLRSLNVAEGGRVTCSSIYGPSNELINFSHTSQTTLTLLPGPPITRGRPLVLLRTPAHGFSVLATMSGSTLSDALAGQTDLRLVIGGSWLDEKGKVHSVVEGERMMSIASSRFPYTVATNITFQHYWLSARALLGSGFVSGLLLCCTLGGGIWHRLQPRWPVAGLRRALLKGEFVAYLQPVMGRSGKAVTGCEVLMRWQHPLKGLIRPDHFIPLAETSGLIVPMTRVLMQQVQQRFGPVSGSLPAGFHFAFNISASHCRDLSLVEDCRAFLASFADQPVKLVLELTERELVVPDATTLQLFAELKALGVGIAVDDFGTGHASLSYLQQFDVDTLKIDRSFVAQLGRDALSTHIVDNVLDLTKRLDLRVVAEGVESPEQRDCLVKRGVDFLQGYLFGKPVPIEDFIRECGYQS